MQELINKFPDTPDAAEAHRAAARFIESPVFQDTPNDWSIVKLIRTGCILYEYPDSFQMTKKGSHYSQSLTNPIGEA